MKELGLALIFFIIGIVLSIIEVAKYNKAKKADGENMNMKPHIIRFVIMLAFFVLSQIFIIMSKH